MSSNSSGLKKPLTLTVSFKAFVSENPKEKQNNINCRVSYRNGSKTQQFEPLLLSNPSNQLILPSIAFSTEDQIQFSYHRIISNEFLGSISFTSDLFFSHYQKEFSQWVTLFDDEEDDIFDGTLGEDDEDVPRAYMSFKISTVPEKKEQPLPESIEQDKNVSFANEDEDSEAGSSDSEEDEDDEEEAPIDDGKYKLEQQIDTEELVKELRERLHSINSPEDLIKVTQELDAKRGNCEADIMKRVFKNRDVVDENGKVIDDAKRVIELEKEISMYRLENEKVSKMETTNKESKQTNTKLEKQYDDLLNKYKNCIESNEKECKQVVTENNELKTEIISLKENIHKLNNQITNLKKQGLEPKYQIEMDKLKVEKDKLKSQNFKKLLEDVSNQKNMLTQSLTQEKEENEKLKQKLEEATTLYKTTLQQAKDLEDDFEERTKQHAENINTLNESLTESQNKILELEQNVSDMTQELTTTREENEKLKAENKSLMENLRNLNKELKEARSAKLQEVNQLTNKINENQLEFERVNNENQHLKRELEFTNIQLKKLQDFDYPTQLRQKEAMLHESEKQRNKLQDEMISVHKQYKQNLEEMTKKIIENHEAMNNMSTEDEEEGYLNKPITIATLREIEERYKQELLEKEKKINDLVYIVKTYKISEQMLAERDKIIEELRKQIAELKETIRRLQEERDNLQKEIFRLTEELIKQTKTNLDQLNTLNKISEDNKRLQQNLDSAIECIPHPKQSSKYIPTKGDKIDKRLSVFINKSKNLPIQFIRIGEGLYTFGTKKIAVKILNGKIVIRVGGGYLMIEEFLRLYTFSELKKLSEIAKTGKNPPAEKKIEEKQEDSESDSESEASDVEPNHNTNNNNNISNIHNNNNNVSKKNDEITPIKPTNMLSPKENMVSSGEGKKNIGKKGKKNEKNKTSKTQQKRFTLFKKEDENEQSGKKKGQDVTLEVTKGGAGVKYGEKQSIVGNTTGTQFHSPRNFQSPPPSKRVLGKK